VWFKVLAVEGKSDKGILSLLMEKSKKELLDKTLKAHKSMLGEGAQLARIIVLVVGGARLTRDTGVMLGRTTR